MALYFFHLCDGEDRLIDPEGRDLGDASVQEFALKEARWIVSQEALDGRIGMSQSIEVRDEGDTVVHRIAFRDAVSIG